MNAPTNLWLIRHAPVDGPRGVIHGPDAPADLGDTAAFAALKARLPGGALAVCSPARRTRETAERLGLDAVEQAAFREQDFGAWTGRRHNELERELGRGLSRILEIGRQQPAARRRKFRRSDRARERRACGSPAGEAILVVHSGTIRAVLAIALDLAPERRCVS